MEKCENHELEKKECKRFRPTLTAYRALEAENNDLRAEYKLLRDYADGLEETIREASANIQALDAEVHKLCHRGLLARIFNL